MVKLAIILIVGWAVMLHMQFICRKLFVRHLENFQLKSYRQHSFNQVEGHNLASILMKTKTIGDHHTKCNKNSSQVQQINLFLKTKLFHVDFVQ